MNAVEFTFIFFILAPKMVSFGCCDNYTFSLCWTGPGEAMKRPNGDLLLNEQSLRLVGEGATVASVAVARGVEHKLTLYHGTLVSTWTLTVDSNTTRTKVTGLVEPHVEPNATKVFQTLSATEVFPCENNTIIFYSDGDFTVALGSTMRLAVTLESRSPSSLLLSWTQHRSNSTTTLYHSTADGYRMLSQYNATDNKHNFTGLRPCSSYLACVQRDAASLVCLFTFTDPEVPQDFRMTHWNSSSISLAWTYPGEHEHFLLTAFHLNGTDHVIKRESFWHREPRLELTMSGLPACSRVRFGLQTVCQEGTESHYSHIVQHTGNSVHSSIEGLCQTAYGPDNYTLSWDIGDASAVSKFRIYNDGQFYGVTSNTNFTVGGLDSCRQYHAKVEAMCGDHMVLNVKMATAHTGLEGVSGLSYHANESTASWTSSLPFNSAVAFLYELSEENGTTIQSSSVMDTALHLPTLEQSKSYVLDVWEQCDGLWESKHSRLCFRGNNLSLSNFIQSFGVGLDQELPFDIFRTTMTLVVPMPEEVHDDTTGQRLIIERIFKEKLEKLMEDLSPSLDIEVTSFEPAEEPGKTAITFVTFDSEDNDYMPLLADEQIDYIQSLGRGDLRVKDQVLYWEGPDLCALVTSWTLCPQHSQCINTLGSYSCVCKPGYYDVSAFVRPSVLQPVCNENGLFSQCLDTFVSGGVARSYLDSAMNGKMDVKLNDGQCRVQEGPAFYSFNVSREGSDCGTERRVNRTHIEFRNRMSVRLSAREVISRRDLKIIWVCVYPRHYVRNTHVSVGLERLEAFSVVQFNTSLRLAMALYTDASFSSTYNSAIQLWSDDFLFVEVHLQTNKTFASDVVLQVESCWATEDLDPDNPIQGVLLQDSCPVDHTFQWHSENGRTKKSRFSVQMFVMPGRKPFYVHCRANVCGPEENCVEDCSSQQRRRRSAEQSGGRSKQSAVVSAGPVVVNTREPSSWTEYLTMIFTVAGSIGLLGLTVLLVSTTKAIMNYYESLRLKGSRR